MQYEDYLNIIWDHYLQGQSAYEIIENRNLWEEDVIAYISMVDNIKTVKDAEILGDLLIDITGKLAEEGLNLDEILQVLMEKLNLTEEIIRDAMVYQN